MTVDDYLEYHDNHCPLWTTVRHCNCWRPKVD